MAEKHTLEGHLITSIISADFDQASRRVTIVAETSQELQKLIKYVRLSPLHYRMFEVPEPPAEAPAKSKKAATKAEDAPAGNTPAPE